MDIYEEFDEESIRNIEKIIQEYMQENGASLTCNAIASIVSEVVLRDNFHDEDDVENDNENEVEEPLEGEEIESQPTLIETIESMEIPLDTAIDIILNDEKIIDNLADALDNEIRCLKESEENKVHVIGEVGSAIWLLSHVFDQPDFYESREYLQDGNQLDKIKEVVDENVSEMEIMDFFMLMKLEASADMLLADSYFSKTVIDIIEDMNSEEFAYYLKEGKRRI